MVSLVFAGGLIIYSAFSKVFRPEWKYALREFGIFINVKSSLPYSLMQREFIQPGLADVQTF